jgi:hypothetical protein
MYLADPFAQLVKLAKKLKKNNVSVDVVNFGEDVGAPILISKLTVQRKPTQRSSRLLFPTSTKRVHGKFIDDRHATYNCLAIWSLYLRVSEFSPTL